MITIDSYDNINIDSLKGFFNCNNDCIELLPSSQLATTRFTCQALLEKELIALVEEAQTILELMKAEVGTMVLTSDFTLKVLLPLDTPIGHLIPK